MINGFLANITLYIYIVFYSNINANFKGNWPQLTVLERRKKNMYSPKPLVMATILLLELYW